MEWYLPVQKSTGIMDRSGAIEVRDRAENLASEILYKKMAVCRKWAAGSDRGWIDGKIILLLWCNGKF